MTEQHTISILLENEAGALSRVAGLFSARAYNIESLAVAPTEDATVSRMTLVTSGSPEIIEQITKQLNKLIDVIRLIDLNDGPHIERELMLIKVRASGTEQRAELNRLTDIFGGAILHYPKNLSIGIVSKANQRCIKFFIQDRRAREFV